MSTRKLPVDEEIKALQLDLVPKKGKSPDQLKKHSLDSQIENKPIERAIFLLNKGDDLQKLSVIQSLTQLTQIDPQASYTRILPMVQQQLPTASSELQISASKVFKDLQERKVPVNLVPSTFQGIENRDPIISNAWLETLMGIIPMLTLEQINTLIIPLAIQKGSISESTQSKVASARILGPICCHPKVDAVEIKKSILPVIHDLYHDPKVEVRATICTQIPLVAKGLSKEMIVQNLLPCLVELSSDNEQLVRAAAIPVVVKMFPYLSKEVMKSTMVPLSKQLCEKSLKYEDVTGVIVAHELGNLLQGLKPYLSPQEAVWFLNCFNTLAHRGLATNPGEVHKIEDSSQDVLCRQECAYNLPAMADFVVNTIRTSVDLLYSVFRGLAADPCYIVRRTVAGGIHEIVRLVSDKSKLIKNDFVRLLRDDTEEVLQSLVPRISNTLVVFRAYNMISRDCQDQTTTEIGRALIKCQMELSRSLNWRLATEFLKQLECLPTCMPNDFIHTQFTPLVLNCAIHGRAKPVRIQAARTVLIFLRNNVKQNSCQWIKDKLITELCNSNSCYTRYIFIHVCIHALDIFSCKYFKEFFFGPLIKLADDPVSNIRGCAYKLFPTIKLMLTREDNNLQSKLDEAMRVAMTKSQPKDVSDILKKIVREMAKLPDKKHLDQMEAREKILVADEDKIARGKPLPLPDAEINHTASASAPNTAIANQANRAKPTNKLNTVQSEMHFLEQHFYIDAGVNLPTLETITSPSSSPPPLPSSSAPTTENLCDDLISALNISSKSSIISSKEQNTSIPSSIPPSKNNITDDVKVNLRKMEQKRSSLVPPNKRYSSILSASCLESAAGVDKILKRRSLNLNNSHSKIPISSVPKPKTPILSQRSGIPVKVIAEKSPLPKSKLQQPKNVKNASKCDQTNTNITVMKKQSA